MSEFSIDHIPLRQALPEAHEIPEPWHGCPPGWRDPSAQRFLVEAYTLFGVRSAWCPVLLHAVQPCFDSARMLAEKIHREQGIRTRVVLVTGSEVEWVSR